MKMTGYICNECEVWHREKKSPHKTYGFSSFRSGSESFVLCDCTGTLHPFFSESDLEKEIQDMIKKNNSIPKERSFTYERGQNRNEALQSLIDSITECQKGNG